MKREIIKNKVSESILSNTPIIYIATGEYNRAISLIKECTQEIEIPNLLFWSQATGIKHLIKNDKEINEEESINKNEETSITKFKDILERTKKTKEKSIYILQNMHNFIEDTKNLSEMLNVIEHITKYNLPITIVAISSSTIIPKEIDKYVSFYQLPLPSRDEIQILLRETNKKYGIFLDSVTESFFIESLNGLTEDEIKIMLFSTLSKVFKEERYINNKDIEIIVNQKHQIINKSGVIEAIPTEKISISDVGGLYSLKSWLEDRKNLFDDISKTKIYGLEPPKGLFLFGMPGTGKSLVSKVVATHYGLPLLKLDMGLIYGKKYPEEAIRRAINLANAISPCIFWMDEIEKAFAGAEAGQEGNEVAMRILGIILTWMQEKTDPVFVIASANDISKIRPEFLRRGRFDEIFFVDFPRTEDEIKSILELHLKKRLKEKFDELVKPLNYTQIHKKMKQMITRYKGEDYAGYSGADIEGLAITAIQKIFFNEVEKLETKDFINILNNFLPSRGTNVKALKDQAIKYDAIKA